MVINLWRYRKFILAGALDDLRHRFAGSAMGVFWNVLLPLSQILVFTFVFSKLMQFKLSGVSQAGSFAIYLCSGMLPWIAFADSILRGADAFVANANYLKKLPIPEQVFTAQTALASTISLLISMGLLFLVVLAIGSPAHVTWLAVPAIIVLFQAFGFGIGLFLSSLNVFFRDIGQMLPVLTQLWMWLTPVVYIIEILPERFFRFMHLNPAFPYIDALHRGIVYGVWPDLWQWNAMALYAGGASLAGYLVLRKLRPELRDAL